MPTLLYSMISLLATLLFGHIGSRAVWFRQRSLLAGILGLLAQTKKIDLSVQEVSKIFSVSSKTVYRNIRGIAELEAKTKGLLQFLDGCIIVPRKDIDKIILSLTLDAHASLEGIQRVLHNVYDGACFKNIKIHLTL